MITENNVVPLFGIPLCQTQLKEYKESEDFIKNKINYIERSHKVCYISEDDYLLDKENLFLINVMYIELFYCPLVYLLLIQILQLV